MKILNLEAKTISDAWFQLIYNILPEDGLTYNQKIQKGSFEGETYRHQYPGVSIFIERPDVDMVPVIPEGIGVPSPTTKEYIDEYFVNYLMSTAISENELYTYGSRINQTVYIEKDGTEVSQLDEVVTTLKKTPLTNQATIEVAEPFDVTIEDPPCLRLISFKVLPIDGKLILAVSVFYRSWDLWAGFPTNLGGIELLKQYVAAECSLENGPMFAYSDGLHIYSHHEKIVRLRTHKYDKKEK